MRIIFRSSCKTSTEGNGVILYIGEGETTPRLSINGTEVLLEDALNGCIIRKRDDHWVIRDINPRINTAQVFNIDECWEEVEFLVYDGYFVTRKQIVELLTGTAFEKVLNECEQIRLNRLNELHRIHESHGYPRGSSAEETLAMARSIDQKREREDAEFGRKMREILDEIVEIKPIRWEKSRRTYKEIDAIIGKLLAE